MTKGLIYIFTGDGKGKTSAAFWTAMRLVLRGERVAVVQFYKEARWPTAEQMMPALLAEIKSRKILRLSGTSHGSRRAQDDNLALRSLASLSSKGRSSKAAKVGTFEVYLSGKGFYKLPTDHATPVEHKRAAEEGLEKVRELLRSKKYAAVILDEVNNTINDKLLKVNEVIKVIESRGKTHLVLTGRGAHKRVIAMADLVTEMRQVKHPFDQGKKAIKGLDY